MREEGGNCLKYLKRGLNRTEGRDTKILKRGSKLGQGVGDLKRGDWNSLTNYESYTLKKLVRKNLVRSRDIQNKSSVTCFNKFIAVKTGN